mgnify:CR=1 FL=1
MKLKDFEKPLVKNTANLLNPIVAESDGVAEKYRERILNSKNSIPCAENIWYVSSKGNDNADGKSKENAIKTIDALKKCRISEGDAVLFERGGVYRGHIEAVSGVYYGSYGMGDKPCIYISAMNYANAKWKYERDNIWSVEAPNTTDIGIIVLNHGEQVGFKRKSIDDLKCDNDYCSNHGQVLFCSEENPAEKWDSVEMGDLNHTILMLPNVHDVTIENITFKYGGSMAVQGLDGVKNITVRNCEIGWMGGCYLPNYKDGNVRYGNGIEFWNGCENVLVEDCWIYQIYDSGFSHQGNGTFVEKDITFRRNLIEYTSFASIEYWVHDANKNSMENITYEDNVLRFAGYGWGDAQRPDIHAYHILSTGKMDHKCSNFKIKGNIMDMSTRGLIKCTSNVGTLPEIMGNTYYQTEGGLLGAYGDADSPIEYFSRDVAEVLGEKFGDTSAKIKFYKSGDNNERKS